jgi:hypothetical protein
VLAGWEEFAHDASIFADSLSRVDGSQISHGKFYLREAMHADLGFYHPREKNQVPSKRVLYKEPTEECHEIV